MSVVVFHLIVVAVVVVVVVAVAVVVVAAPCCHAHIPTDHHLPGRKASLRTTAVASQETQTQT